MTKNNAEIIKERIELHLQPKKLDVIDDSNAHRGHDGYQGGGRHFTIRIAADAFINQPRLAIHRKIYSLFTDMMPDKIHALSIKIID